MTVPPAVVAHPGREIQGGHAHRGRKFDGRTDGAAERMDQIALPGWMEEPKVEDRGYLARRRRRMVRKVNERDNLLRAQVLLDMVDADGYVIVKTVLERLITVGRRVHQIFEGSQARDFAGAPICLGRGGIRIRDAKGKGAGAWGEMTNDLREMPIVIAFAPAVPADVVEELQDGRRLRFVEIARGVGGELG